MEVIEHTHPCDRRNFWAHWDRICMEDSCAEKPGAIHAAYTLADALSRDNPRFDRARFLEACGVAS